MLEARDISISYGPCTVIAGVSLQVASGKLTAILGPNGAGKSTLLRALNGTLIPSDGTILLDNHALARLSRRTVSRQVAVVPQETEVRFPVTVLEFVLGGRYARRGGFGWETEADLAAAHKVLRECDLANYAARLMSELSGGERQRVVLARALATEAKFLLLDEPTANLDLAHQALMLQLVRLRCDTQQAGAVFVTHDINLAAEFADEILLLTSGRVLAQGTPHEVLLPDLLQQLFGLAVLVDTHPLSGAPRITPIMKSAEARTQ